MNSFNIAKVRLLHKKKYVYSILVSFKSLPHIPRNYMALKFSLNLPLTTS